MSLYNDLNEVLTPYANKIKEVNESLGDVANDVSLINGAVPEDVGKILKVKSVSGGKVSQWEFTSVSGGAGGMSQEAKTALLACIEKVAWAVPNGDAYYDALYDALMNEKVLQSISAVFTQGSVIIREGDDLSKLRPLLVVTAHYDDSTTKTLTTYTLSGTLSEGTSVITVAYGKTTTTFNVTVVSEDTLPTGYTNIEYVWAKGDKWGGCSVNTNVAPDENTEIEYVAEYGGFGQPSAHLLSCTGYYSLHLTAGANGSLFANRCGNESRISNNSKIQAGVPFEVRMYRGGSDDVILDGTKIMTISAGGTTPTGNFSIFTYDGRTGYYANLKLYSMKIYDGSTIIRNFIPCINPSNVVGLYDVVNGTFYSSSTATPLEAPAEEE